jgi:hypothetical protein
MNVGLIVQRFPSGFRRRGYVFRGGPETGVFGKDILHPTAGCHRARAVFEILHIDVHVSPKVGRGRKPRSPLHAGG